MELSIVCIDKPDDMNFILGQAHFIKTVEDLHEALIQTVPGIMFGLAFCEASGPRLVRSSGTDKELVKLAEKNAMNISAGHSFIIMLKNAFPINILPVIRQVPEVCRIFCATANSTEVVVADTASGRGILGVIDGRPPTGIENEEEKNQRRIFLRDIGYKL